MDENERQAVQQRALASALLSAADRKDLSMLKATAETFRTEPDLAAIYAGVRATAPIVLPTLETLLDPMYDPRPKDLGDSDSGSAPPA